MTDTRRVEFDTTGVAKLAGLRALEETKDMSAPKRAEHLLQALARFSHRGRHDTWTAARDRAAQKAGIPLTMAKRIWQRWQTMQDVSGDALIKLMIAYEDMCRRNDAAAAAYRAERLAPKDGDDVVSTMGLPDHDLGRMERGQERVGAQSPLN